MGKQIFDLGKVNHRKNLIKANIILLEFVNDHPLSNMHDLNSPTVMFDYLSKLYESRNSSQKVALKIWIRAMYYNPSEAISSYFSKLKQLKHQLKAIDASMDEYEL